MKRVFVNGIILACIMETHSTKEPHGESLYKMKGKIDKSTPVVGSSIKCLSETKKGK